MGDVESGDFWLILGFWDFVDVDFVDVELLRWMFGWLGYGWGGRIVLAAMSVYMWLGGMLDKFVEFREN